MNIATVSTTVALIGTIAGGAVYIERKPDRTEVAQTLEEREYQRYEEKIEEIQDEKRRLKRKEQYDKEHVEQLELRIRKYEKRQDRITK